MIINRKPFKVASMYTKKLAKPTNASRLNVFLSYLIWCDFAVSTNRPDPRDT